MALRIAFCIPGREFSGRFLDCWTNMIGGCERAGIEYVVSREYDPVVYYARNKVLGGNLRAGREQAPWGGKVPYDFMLWIDSDMVFRFEDLVTLLQHNVDVVSGLYLMHDGKRFATVERWDQDRLAETGSLTYLTPADLAKRDGIFPVSYTGLGFMLVRRGVFERIEYPWFRPEWIEAGEVREFTSEDVGLCLALGRAGIAVQVDPKVVLGHEKSRVLLP